MFVSSKTHNGQFPPSTGGSALTGFSGADSFCKDLAEGSTVSSIHGLKWVAWLSTSLGTNGNARDRIPTSSAGDFLFEYRLTDGVTQVFPKGFNFDSSDAGPQSPKNPIALDENGQALSDALVWTGTRADGKVRIPTDCGGWNAKDPALVNGAVGTSGDLNTWSANGNALPDPCSLPHSLYCFQVP